MSNPWPNSNHGSKTDLKAPLEGTVLPGTEANHGVDV